MSLRVSALDLATTSGLAWGRLGEAPQTESWRLGQPGATAGARGLELMRRFLSHLKAYEPELVVIETPLPPNILVKIGGSAETARFLPGVVFLAEVVCCSRGIESELIDRQRALQHFVGRSRFSKKGDAKKACLARCWQLGWKVESEDEADAVCLWDFAAASRAGNAWAKVAIERPIFAT